ncbi:MAG: hypothetical protein V4629_03575 [Pseudomonadota bacterium]
MRFLRLFALYHAVGRNIINRHDLISHIKAYIKTTLYFTAGNALLAAILSLALKDLEYFYLSIVYGAAIGFGIHTLMILFVIIFRTIPEIRHDFQRYVTAPNPRQRVIDDRRELNQLHNRNVYAYDWQPSRQAIILKKKIQFKLLPYTLRLINLPQIRQQIIEHADNRNLTPDQITRLQNVVNTNSDGTPELLRLCWNFINFAVPPSEKENLQRQFIHYLATMQGCAHGRGNQIIHFFTGIIDGIDNTDSLKKLPEGEEKLNILGDMSGALRPLGNDFDKQSAKQFLQPLFVAKNSFFNFRSGNTIQADVTYRKMTQAIFDKLYEELWPAVAGADEENLGIMEQKTSEI